MNRRLMVSLVAAGLLVAVASTPVAADTGPVEPADVWLSSADFSFTDRGIAYAGIAQIEEDRLHGTTSVSFFFSGSGASRLCDAGTSEDPSDDYEGTESIEFFATHSTVLFYQIEADLSEATAAFAMAGQRIRTDACSGEIRFRRSERHVFGYHLIAVAPPDVSEDIFVVDNGDGTFSEVTERFSIAAAGGLAVLDRESVTVSGGSLQHLEVIVEPV
jgi:hypothetical protein